MPVPICPYCGEEAKPVKGDVIYHHRRDLYSKKFWLCSPCDAYVGCHGDGRKPLGRLADKRLRQRKMAAHKAFDPIWRSGNVRRSDAYRWLAAELGIEFKKCHIGMFDEEMCGRVIEAVKRRKQCAQKRT